MSEETEKWSYKDTCVYTGDGGFDLRDLPNPLQRAKLIVDAVNSYSGTAAKTTPGSAELLALAEAVGRVVPEHSSDRKVLLKAERALRLAAKPAEDMREATIDKILFDFEGKFRRFDYKERDWLRERFVALSTMGAPKP